MLVSSAGVTRPNRPGINVDEEPPAVKLNDALGGILTYKLKGGWVGGWYEVQGWVGGLKLNDALGGILTLKLKGGWVGG